jgi:hypothetical protein
MVNLRNIESANVFFLIKKKGEHLQLVLLKYHTSGKTSSIIIKSLLSRKKELIKD